MLDRDGETINSPEQQKEIIDTLGNLLSHPEELSNQNVNLTRQLKHFPIETKVIFREDTNNNRTEMEVITGDRPGLLARISKGLMECETVLQNAKIATFGERAEDIFYITNNENLPLDTESRKCLEETITRLLDE